MKSGKVTDCDTLDNLNMPGILSHCFIELRQHLIKSKLTEPRDLGKVVNLWLSPSVEEGTEG